MRKYNVIALSAVQAFGTLPKNTPPGLIYNSRFNPWESVTYTWYAGEFGRDSAGHLDTHPIEFGTVGLAPADPIFQHTHGLLGVLIIEPKGSTWSPDDRSTALITPAPDPARKTSPPFHEFVLALQDQTDNSTATPGVNYKNELMTQRYNPPPTGGNFSTIDISQAFANSLVKHRPADTGLDGQGGRADPVPARPHGRYGLLVLGCPRPLVAAVSLSARLCSAGP